MFAWPSHAQIGDYVTDCDSATYSRDALAALLTSLAQGNRFDEISVLAHSMGGWLTVEALRQLSLTGQERGVYVYMSIVAGLFIAAVIWRVVHVEAPEQKERPFVILTERMGQPISHVAEEEDIGSGGHLPDLGDKASGQ